MSLLDLPLVLFRDIIKLAVASPPPSGTSVREALDLRLVSRLFEVEATKFFARHRLEGCRKIGILSIVFPQGIYGYEAKPEVPRDFIIRLLEEYIGWAGPKHSYMAAVFHHAVDELVEQSKTIGKIVERDQALRDACEALYISGESENMFTESSPVSPPASENDLDQKELRNTTFIIAILMGYTNVEEAILATGPVDAGSAGWTFGLPLARAVEFGHLESVKRIIAAEPSTVRLYSRNMPYALRCAARSGHLAVIEFVLNSSPYFQEGAQEDALTWILRSAAQSQQWDLVEALFEKYRDHIYDGAGKVVMCQAAKHGADNMILKLIRYGFLPRNEREFGCRDYPLREAVRYGHLSTVKILLDNGALGDEVESHIDVLAQNVAMGGNFEVFQLLRENYFWKSTVEWLFLPYAAEYGQTHFLQHAADYRRVPRKNPLGPDSTEDLFDYICQISVLIAVAAGQLSSVRWFAEELGCDMNTVTFSARGEEALSPLILAVDSGNTYMVELLTKELNAKFLGDEFKSVECEYGKRAIRREELGCLRTRLNLSHDPTRKPYVPYKNVEKAFWMAKGMF